MPFKGNEKPMSHKNDQQKIIKVNSHTKLSEEENKMQNSVSNSEATQEQTCPENRSKPQTTNQNKLKAINTR